MDVDDADVRTQSLFSDVADLLDAEEWLLRIDYSASKPSELQETQRRLRDQVKRLLVDLLPDVHEIRFNASSGVIPKPGVEFRTSFGWVSLRQLGYGYQSMIAWLVDFGSRMVEQYPDSPDPFTQPALVLIDEIDLHLHPRWQRHLIRFLTERFPNTQFIATAHSPLIVQSASGGNIALLRCEGDQIVIENDIKTIRGWRIDQILTSDLFGIESARPPEFDSDLARRKELLTKPELTASDNEELERLESKIGLLPSGETFEQAKTMMLIEKSLKDLKAKIRGKS